MRIAVFWWRLNGYLNACLKALAAHEDVELFVTYCKGTSEAPYDEEQFAWMNPFCWKTSDELVDLEARVARFNPDVILAVGWSEPEYRRVCKLYQGKATRIISMDNNWLGTPKQWLGVIGAPYILKPIADAVWVPGERQAAFASRLGFQQNDMLRGLYCCDYHAFAPVYRQRLEAGAPLPKRFLFVGRFAPEKGISTLVEAYRKYREATPDPWPLTCCGAGPLRHLLENQPGIEIQDFVQPQDLPKVFANAGCFVLPSTFEPWAVVVHEATAAGLIMLASSVVGAVPHLVQPYYNGFVFDAGDSHALATSMGRVTKLSPVKLEEMSTASAQLAMQFTPERWAETLVSFALERQMSRAVSPA